jgi:hypothetical protein
MQTQGLAAAVVENRDRVPVGHADYQRTEVLGVGRDGEPQREE